MEYVPRVVDQELERRLASSKLVVIEGPKACGKTVTASRAAASSVRLDIDDAARTAALVDPRLILEGATPRLIDEWQVAPGIWNHARHFADDRGISGQFILTGSSVPDDDPNRHSGAGRFSFLRMRPMSLFEAGHSTGAVSLAAMLAGDEPRSAEPGLTLDALADVMTIGGWPGQLGATVAQGARAARDYITQMRQVDVSRVAGGFRDPSKMGRLIRALARNVATEVTVSTLATDAGGPEGPLARNTVAEYLDVLERLMIIEDQPAWAPHMRSKSPLRHAPKRHFVDPSLAVAALSAGPRRLLNDLNLFGLLFESLVVRDLRILSQPIDGEVLHFRDKTGLEVDAIVQLDDGRWAAFEVKLGGQQLIDEGAASLRRFAAAVDTDRCGGPAALAVICASGYGLMRRDGVGIIPVGALAP